MERPQPTKEQIQEFKEASEYFGCPILDEVDWEKGPTPEQVIAIARYNNECMEQAIKDNERFIEQGGDDEHGSLAAINALMRESLNSKTRH